MIKKGGIYLKREYWIDELKGVAILFVVFEHTIARTLAGLQFESSFLSNLDFFIKTFHMPLFFLASGYIYAMHEREKLKTIQYGLFVKKSFFDLFLPYLIFALPIWFGKYIFSHWVTRPVSIKDLLLMFVNPIAFLWFIYILFFIKIIIAGLDKLTKYKTEVIFLIAIISAFSRCFITTDIKLVDRVLYYPICYVSGMMFFKYRSYLSKIPMLFVVSILSVAAWVLAFAFPENRPCIIFVNVASIMMITSIFYFVRFKTAEKKNFISYLGQISIYIYILHPIILNAIRMVLLKLNIENVIAWFLILFFGGVICSVIYHKLSEKLWLFEFPFKPRRVYNDRIVPLLKKSKKAD